MSSPGSGGADDAKPARSVEFQEIVDPAVELPLAPGFREPSKKYVFGLLCRLHLTEHGLDDGLSFRVDSPAAFGA